MHTLVTLLGRTLRRDDGYQRVAYQFPDGDSHQKTFVGYALTQREQPDRLVILGTRGSMWDQLLTDGLDVPLAEKHHYELVENVDDQNVSQEELDTLATALSSALDREVRLQLIPEGVDTRDQVEILNVLVSATEATDSLTLDITHGYRHLPMLAVMAVLYLRAYRPAMTLHGIWYAMLHSPEARATMHDVGGIQHFADWLSALQQSELTGDYSAVAQLISDPETAQNLQDGGFLETIHQGQLSKKHIQKARQRMAEQPLEGAGALFQPLLLERTSWVESPYLYQRQRAHALNALQRSDLLRAALFGFEAFVTRLVRELGPPNADPNNRDTREAARREYEDNGPSNPNWPSYKSLRDVRNVLAHGNRGRIDESTLRSPDALRETLATALHAVLPEKLAS